MSAALPLTSEADGARRGHAPVFEATRRRLTERQAEVVRRLVDAAADEVDEVGYDRLTVRGVARRAGVATATAYHYFSSKDHLLAEILWRHLQDQPPAGARGGSRAERLEDAVRGIVGFAADRPGRVDAYTVALLASNPDVKHLRDRIGAEVHRRLATALGPDTDPEVVRVLETSYFGALLMAGMGHLPYQGIPAFVRSAATVMLDGDGEGAGGSAARRPRSHR